MRTARQDCSRDKESGVKAPTLINITPVRRTTGMLLHGPSARSRRLNTVRAVGPDSRALTPLKLVHTKHPEKTGTDGAHRALETCREPGKGLNT